jgi:hypothetical protein
VLILLGLSKEVKSLPEVLREGETVKGLTSGFMDGNTWLIVCTERRIIFLDKGMLYGLKQKDTPLEKINSIEHKIGMIFGKITIRDAATEITIDNLQKAAVAPFLETVNSAIEALKNSTNAPPPAGNEPVDVASQLGKLTDLRDKGVLTEEEFQGQKKKLLSL